MVELPAGVADSNPKTFLIHYEEQISYALTDPELENIRHGGHVWGKDVAIGAFAIMVPCALNAYDRYLSFKDSAISNFQVLVPSLLNAVFAGVGLVLIIIFGSISIVSSMRVGAIIKKIKNKKVVSATASTPGSNISTLQSPTM